MINEWRGENAAMFEDKCGIILLTHEVTTNKYEKT